jgi:hypothetical protein
MDVVKARAPEAKAKAWLSRPGLSRPRTILFSSRPRPVLEDYITGYSLN